MSKTATAARRAKTQYDLDAPGTLEIIQAEPGRLLEGREPILIDEWHRYPPSWDLVRRAVDKSNRPARFLLTGSASPVAPGTHSRAGRIVTIRMRPLTLFERGLGKPAVSLSELIRGERPRIHGKTPITLTQYVEERQDRKPIDAPTGLPWYQPHCSAREAPQPQTND